MTDNQIATNEPEEELDTPNNGLERFRKKVREEKSSYREHQRNFLLKKVRFFEDDETIENISNSDIKSLAESLKCKSQMSCELLNAVMNALLESPGNITAFLSVGGALQALLRALSGHNEKYQLIAARCISNLALGNEKQSLQVLKAAESYLLVHLSGKNRYLIEACVTAVGNFSNHGTKHINFLVSQGFFPNIVNLLFEVDSAVQLSAIYALQQIIYFGFDIIELEEKEKLLLAVLPIFTGTNTSSVAFLMSLLTSCEILVSKLLPECDKICGHALKCLETSVIEGQDETVYYLRIVNNLISEETATIANNLMHNYPLFLGLCVRNLLASNEQYLKKECLSLIGNFLNHPCKSLGLFGMELINENYPVIQTAVDELQKLPSDVL